MKKIFTFLLTISFLIPGQALALTKDEAIKQYKAELVKLSMEEPDADKMAKSEAELLMESMETAQYDVDSALKALDSRVNGLLKNDPRRETAKAALAETEKKVKAFTVLEAQNEMEVQPAISGALPRMIPHPNFEQAQIEAQSAMNEVNRILIGPVRPGQVPEGDLVSDFLPQIIRQLFRFAWVAILIALTVSGVMLVMSKDKEERVTRAKEMIFYSIIGFAVIALAFAIVKAITDIDFFGFI